MGLTSALESGNCVLFVGAGAGYEMTNSSGEPAPAGDELAIRIATHFGIDRDGITDLAAISQLAENRHGRSKLIAFVDKQLADLRPSEHLQWLQSLTWKAIFTTNYDDAIERCYDLIPNPTQKPISIASNSEATSWDPRFEVPVFHLHGRLSATSDKEAILITQSDYASFRSRRQMLFNHFRVTFAGTPILYYGYRNADPNWQMATSEVRSEYSPAAPPTSYRISPGTSAIDRELLAAQGVVTLDGYLSDFRDAVEMTFGELRVEPSRLDAIKEKVPPDLRALFSESPAATSRLLNAWEYVNQADFSGLPNTKDFLRGDRPNWPLIATGQNFERDLEAPLVDRLADFATDPKARVTCEIALGPAGYGMSTLLMAVAGWFTKNRIGKAFFLRPGMQVRTGDVEFATAAFDEPVIFIIDNAADYTEEIASAVEILRNSSLPAFFLLGERLNEWRQRHSPLRAQEHLLEPLSDGEIDRLLDSLSAVGELGHLEDLSPDLRFSAVKNRNSKELLVTMREVTEGRAFDAIIEDEYRGIMNDGAKQIYGLVCAFSRVRSLARDLVCADALNRNVVDLYSLVGDSLEGIVRWETVDEARGIEALRARHQTIANIVWERCLDRLDRERTLMSAIASLNLTFGIDSRAFEAFTRDDQAVDSLQSLEAKSRFFEESCRKDPRNAYVRQHYARMLRREGHIELALGQIDAALEIGPGLRVLQHTRGVILRDAALEASTTEIGRRRLAQSESAFRSAIRKNSRDEYAYQSLAELYLDWARHIARESERESIDYVARAQEVVTEGMPRVRNREGLYVVSAKIETWLGDEAKHLEALRSALVAAPSSAVVRYLYGNALRSSGELSDARAVLETGLIDHPDDPSLAWACAMTILAQTGDYAQPLAMLRLARLRGEYQPRFVATFGGMLVMAGQLADARDVWKRAEGRGFSLEDRNRIYFEPGRLSESGSRIRGEVLQLHPGFAFVGAPGKPDVFCPGSKFTGVSLRPGMPVEFSIAFSARGPVVADIKEVA